MPVSVPIELVNINAPLPATLAPHINQAVWNEIIHAKSTAYGNAHSLACAGEWLGCLCFCIPFCLCHSCIHPLLAQSELNNSMYRINQAHFQNHGVCQCTSQYLVIVHESIPANMNTSASQVVTAAAVVNAEPTVYPAVSSNNQGGLTESTYAGPIAHATPVSNGNSYAPMTATDGAPRTMNVMIPQGTEPGSTLTVATPEGLQVQVQVPQGMKPGQEIRVQY